jgi:cation-transporting P-type ATPase 13A2
MPCKTTFGDTLFFPAWRIPYPYHASTVFASFNLPTKTNGNGASSINGEDFLLENLLVVDYRYARFALDPNSGLFNAVKCVESLLLCLTISNVMGKGTGEIIVGQA